MVTQLAQTPEHKPKMTRLCANKAVEEIENNGYRNVGFVGLMNGVDESPVVFQPLISEHPVHDGPGFSRTFFQGSNATGIH